MNLGALRLLKLLSGGNGAAPPSSFGDPVLDSLPPPRYDGAMPGDNQGLTPEEINAKVPIPNANPIPNAANDPEEQRIRDLYTQSPQGVEDYKKYLSQAPTHDKYEASTGRKIFAMLAGAGQELANNSNAKHGVSGPSGVSVAEDIVNTPYNDALKDWSIRGKGLGEVASLSEKQQGNAIRGEEAVQGVRARKENADIVHQQAVDALSEKAREADQRSQDTRNSTAERAQASKDSLQARQELRAMMEQHHQDSLASQGTWVDDPANPGKQKFVHKSEAFGATKSTTQDQNRLSTASEVLLGLDNIQKLMTPANLAKLGSLKGKAQQAWIENGFSDDPELMKLARELDTVEKKHTGITGNAKASLALIKDVRKNLGGIGQNPSGVQVSLDVMRSSAHDAINARTPKGSEGTSKFTEKKLKDGTVIQVEE